MKTKKIKNVLIALDYNPTAQKIAELGFAFATAMQELIIPYYAPTRPHST